MSEWRVLDLQGVHNFRDYGGYAVSGGGRLKRDVLWRSGQHHGATDEDLERIAALGLASVFDLRSSTERDLHPCRRPEGFSARIHHSDDPPPSARRTAPHVQEAIRAQRRSPETAREGMRKNYAKMPFRPELQAATRALISRLGEGAGPSLVNCMAGKDRTGIAVAMVHLATGVHRDDVLADYVLTNTAGDPEARIAAGMETVRAMGGDSDEATLRVVMGVEPEYLESAFAGIEEECGSIDAYLSEALSVDDAMRVRLRDFLVES